MCNLESIQEEAANQLNNQPKGDFISLYDLIEWVKIKNNNNFIAATYDIYTILEEDNKDVFSYKYHSGIKPCTTKTDKKLKDYVAKLNINKGYLEDDDFDDDIGYLRRFILKM